MTNIDFSPLFRTAIGFDQLANALENAYQADKGTGYPPYNIELLGEDEYRISMAVAGFSRDDLNIEVHNNRLTVSGSHQESVEDNKKYLHRGIATRTFERTFQLADHVRVEDAEMKDGLLHIRLIREVPEALKPRQVEIRGDADDKLIEGQSEQAA